MRDKITPCECPLAGFCHRHGVDKNASLHKLCQTKPAYYQAWEEGKGPRQYKAGPMAPDKQAKQARNKAERDRATAEAGRKQWLKLHTYAPENAHDWRPSQAKQWYEAWLPHIPSYGCSCKNHWKELTKKNPMAFDSPETFFEKSVELHNIVSTEKAKRHKPAISLEEAYTLFWNRLPASTCNYERLIITVATGTEWGELLRTTQLAMKAYAEKCNADFIALTNETEEWWGLEKFRVKHFANHYRQTLFVDADVIIRHSCPNLFEMVPDGQVGIHDDYPYLNGYDWMEPERQAVATSQGITIPSYKTCLNSGVVLTSRNNSDIWTRPPLPFPSEHHCAEQFWVEHLVQDHTIFKLPTAFNTQHWMRHYEKLKKSAHILHLANAKDRLALAKEAIQENFQNAISK